MISWLALIVFIVQWIHYNFWTGFWSYAAIVATAELIGWAFTLLVLAGVGSGAGLAALFGRKIR